MHLLELPPSPPTHFNTNTFTAPFQLIVNTYGIPRYQEVNPGLFTIIMFPFLFGVMFGDIMHGGILFLAGIYICRNYESIKKSWEEQGLGAILELRFLIVLMGWFAFFSGWIYNDFGSIPIDIFGSCF